MSNCYSELKLDNSENFSLYHLSKGPNAEDNPEGYALITEIVVEKCFFLLGQKA